MSGITELHQIDLHSGQITKPRWSPNGRLLALPTESGSTAIFKLDTGKVEQTVGLHSGRVTSVCWDRESELIMTGSLDRSIGVWDLASGNRAPFALGGHNEPVHSVDWTDEGAYAMTCSVDRVRAWDGYCLQTGWTGEMENVANKTAGFTAASCSWHTTLLLGMAAENGALLLLANLVSAELLDSVPMFERVRCLAWSPRQDVLAAGTSEGIVAFHATPTGFEGSGLELTRDAHPVHAIAFSGDGAFLASYDDDGLKIWDFKRGKVIVAMSEDVTLATTRMTSGIAFHPTRPLLAAVTPAGNQFRILDLSNLA